MARNSVVTKAVYPFNFEITKLVRDVDNFLVVKVDNKRRRDAVPTLNTDWWNYGGLTRPVSLVEVPEIFIEDYSPQLKKGSLDELAWVKLNGAVGTQEVQIKIPEAKVSQTVGRTTMVMPRSPSKLAYNCGPQRIRSSMN